MVNPELSTEERVADAALRPSSLDEFVGQKRVKDQLQLVLMLEVVYNLLMQ
jgi:Holliday junction DNA helicase RuvB